MKIRLRENPGYCGMGSVKFPVEVEAEVSGSRAYVPKSELYRIGAKRGFDALTKYCFPQGSWEKTK